MTEIRAKLDRLLSYLEQDPTNPNLLKDAAETAFEAGDFAKAAELIDRHAALGRPLPELLNISGMMALHTGNLARADEIFSHILQQDAHNTAVRCNLALTKAAELDWPAVGDLLDDAAVAAEPRMTALKVRTFQHLGRPEDALAWADRLPEHAPLDAAALSALAVASVDAADLKRAQLYAQAAGETPEAAFTLGFVALSEGRPQAAEPLFDRALAQAPDQGRALLGKGLARMSADDPVAAAAWLDRAASSFETHLGSWIAAGWAYFAAGDLTRSRERFATALALDDTFAETHGALAVLDLLQGDKEAARRGVEVALRLDRQCFSGLLGKLLLLESEGDAVNADRLRKMAVNIPVGSDGLTLGAAMARLRR